MLQYRVAAFYKFIELADIQSLQVQLQKICEENNVFGTILLAVEGINGTIGAKQGDLQRVISKLLDDPRFADLDIKYSDSQTMPFKKTKILIKKEIVTFAMPHLKPHEKTGIPVSPTEWHDLMADPEVLVIDTRNEYEVALGTFKKAINPQTEKFSDFIDFVHQTLDATKHKKIAMYCTGGIRCEKASSYLLQLGFENVYQLQGGILKYLAEVKHDESQWEGDCFIFDTRVSVNQETLLNSAEAEKKEKC
jgi:UPF0176 protein